MKENKDFCRLCGANATDSFGFSMKNMPSRAQKFSTIKTFSKTMKTDLFLYQCKYCGLSQLKADPVFYYKQVFRANNYSESMEKYRKKQFIDFITDNRLKGKHLLEVGSGPADNLKILKNLPIKVTGVEFKGENLVNSENINEVSDFFDSENKLIEGNPFDGFFCFNFLEHIPNPLIFLRAIRNNLKEGSPGIFEVPNFEMIKKYGVLSEVMLDHLIYFTRETLLSMLNISGFKTIKISTNFNDYFLTAHVKTEKKIISEKVFSNFEKMNQEIIKNHFENRRNLKLVLWGAGHQANALVKLYKLEKYIDYVCDSSPKKIDRFLPGTSLKIKSPEQLFKSPNLTKKILVAAGGYSSEVLKIIKSKMPLRTEVFVFDKGLIKKCK